MNMQNGTKILQIILQTVNTVGVHSLFTVCKIVAEIRKQKLIFGSGL